MRCKIVRTRKLMWRNIMRSTKSQKTSILLYSIDFHQLSLIHSYLLIRLRVSYIDIFQYFQ